MKNKREKVITIIAIVVCVLVVSIGFSTFTSNLVIKLNASVSPSDTDFQVKFSTSKSSVTTDNAIITNTSGITVGTPVISNSSTSGSSTGTISGLSATFTEPGQSVTYKFYVLNTGNYSAYLASLSMDDTSCTATNVSSNLKETVCNNIKETVKISNEVNNGIDESNYFMIDSKTKTLYKLGTPSGVINKSGYKVIEIKLEYTGDTYPDGNVNVTFGDVELAYSSVNSTIVALDESKVCNLVSGTKGHIGSKYLCSVNDTEKYYFYLLSINTSNTFAIATASYSDVVNSYNLVLDGNICSNGKVVKDNSCNTTWSNSSATMTPNEANQVFLVLDNATSSWNKISSTSVTYGQESNDYYNCIVGEDGCINSNTFTHTGKARIISESEYNRVKSYNSDILTNSYIPYWISSVKFVADDPYAISYHYEASYIYYNKGIKTETATLDSTYAVKPVINVNLSDIN